MQSKWINKIKNYTAEPPASAWEGITAALDKESETAAHKLYHYQPTPPASAWEKISQQLDAAPEAATLVPVKQFKKVLRYAAAAVILFMVGGSVYFLMQKPATGNNMANAAKESLLEKVQTKAHNYDENTVTLMPRPQVTTIPTTLSQKSKMVSASIKRNLKKLTPWKQSAIVIPADILPTDNEIAVVPQEKNLVNTALADRYMIVTTTNGDAVRLPKKVYSVYACNDESLYSSEQACRQKLSFLQSKMSASLATDFAQFLDLLKNLQENTN